MGVEIWCDKFLNGEQTDGTVLMCGKDQMLQTGLVLYGNCFLKYLTDFYNKILGK